MNEDPTVRYLLALVAAAASGWDHETSVAALRMHGSPLERFGDLWEYRVLARIPGRGLDTLRSLAPEFAAKFFEQLAELSAWIDGAATPAVWAQRFQSIPALFRPPAITDGASQDQVLAWRTQAAALEHFRAVAVETAAAFGNAMPVDFATFVAAFRTTISGATIHIVDHRRDVVHVMDAVEARQWRLPVVFVCGLLEGQFPKRYAEDAVLPDSVRRRLQSCGVPLKTSMEKQTEEDLLFDVAMTRATDHTVLTYAQLNAKGEPNLPSFLLERARPWETGQPVAARPYAVALRPPEIHSAIQADNLLERLSARHSVLSPSSIERYLNCPFQFFAEKTLKLNPSPCDPWERFDPSVQGSIAHRVFERHFRDGVPVALAFEEAFEAERARRGLPEGYRTEAIRLELLYSIQLLVSDMRLRSNVDQALFEVAFELKLSDETGIRGRIDRLDVDANGNAVVIDYKYRRAYRIRDARTENEDGTKVQGGLYLMGAKALGYTPAGMIYCGFKREVSAAGWVLPPFYPGLKSECSPAHLDDVMNTAQEVAINAASGIRSGRIAPEPADASRCELCSLSAMCRIEVAAARRTSGVSIAAE